jgi:hypothetical protein
MINILEKNIHLIPKSINDLFFESYDKKGMSIETMHMFYSFGLLIEKIHYYFL